MPPRCPLSNVPRLLKEAERNKTALGRMHKENNAHPTFATLTGKRTIFCVRCDSVGAVDPAERFCLAINMNTDALSLRTNKHWLGQLFRIHRGRPSGPLGFCVRCSSTARLWFGEWGFVCILEKSFALWTEPNSDVRYGKRWISRMHRNPDGHHLMTFR